MLEIFAPYMLFISFLLTVLFNLWLISKNTRWFVIIIANLLLILIMEFLDLAEYNFLNKIVDWIVDFIVEVIGGLFEKLWDVIKDFISGIWDAIKDFISGIFRLRLS